MVAAPLSDDELASRADLVVEARVLTRANSRAAIGVKRVIKGRPRYQNQGWLRWPGLDRLIIVEYKSMPPEPRLGDWWNEDAFAPGNRIRACLAWDDRAQCYRSIWWNGIAILR